MTAMALIGAMLAASITFVLSLWQSRHLAGLGSDQPVHIFLANVIRENHFRLFRQVPRLVNPSYCGAYPLFLHWLLALAGTGNLARIERYLNPTLNAVVVGVLAIMLMVEGHGDLVAPACVLLALTPQFYHALSARNYGISARPLGLLLFFVLANLAMLAAADGDWAIYAAGTACAYLVWGCSTFALQMTLFSALARAVMFGDWLLLAFTIAGGLLFFTLHPRYGPSYAWHTFRFSRAYGRKLAALFILNRRHSIWRDFIRDFWLMARTSPIQQTFRYVYENAVVIAVFLNVTTPLALALWLFDNGGTALPALVAFALEMAAIGAVLFVLTTFRATRFLGEPERYLEMTAPFTVAATAYLLDAHFGSWALMALVGYFAAVDAAQLRLTQMVRQVMQSRAGDVADIVAAVESAFGGQPIRFTSNNDELLKYFQVQPWSFARYWSYAEPYAGYELEQAFAPFPNLRTEVVEAAIRQYDVNVCLIDRMVADRDDLFAQAPAWRDRLQTLLETPDYRLVRIHPAVT